MKLLSVVTAAALAAVSLSAVAAPAGMVSYTCDNGKQLNALYEFDRQGRAVNVAVNAAAATPCLPAISTKTPTPLPTWWA